MIMMGIECTGQIPFRQVYIHGLVRDAERQKMSKTKGNVIDPLEVTVKYGTDAIRMALLQGAAPGTDIVISDDRMQSARAFANKIWNAARFVFLKMEQSGVEPWIPEEPLTRALSNNLEDRWIVSRLNRAADQMNKAIATYRYHEAAHTAWSFFWHEYCDWYVELKKLRFRDNSGLTDDWRNTLAVLEASLRLLHPVMPFLTEELWQRLAANAAKRPKSVAMAAFPQLAPEALDEAAEADMELLQEVITAARNLRAELKLDPKEQLTGSLYSTGAALRISASNAEAIEKLAGVNLKLVEGPAPKIGGAMRATPAFELGLDVPESQLAALRKRLEKEVEQLEKNIANSRRQLSDDTFLGRAPAHVVASLRDKLAEYEAQSKKSQEALSNL